MKRFFGAGTGLHANRSRAGTLAVFLILLGTSFLMMLPFAYSILQSVKPMEELFAFPPKLFVQNPTFENYRKLFQLTGNLWVPFSRYVFNSVFVAAAGTAGYVLVASMAAYALAFGNFPGVKLFNAIVVQALLFNATVLTVSQYVVIARANLMNTYWAVILPVMATPLGLFLMRQFMVQMIPKSMLEAARIDGAGVFTIFWRVVMPIVKPAWLTLIIFSFQSLWSDAGNRYVYEEQFKALPTVLKQISGGGMARAGIAAAAAVVLMLPPILVFMFAQRNVLETMATSGIKE